MNIEMDNEESEEYYYYLDFFMEFNGMEKNKEFLKYFTEWQCKIHQ
jgi:hypothetical protein